MDVVVGLLCGVALFLFGMLLMGSGLKNVAGNKLEMILFKLTNTPLKGVLLGTGVTAIIQSSSATSIMAVGFVNSGMMKMRQAIGIILGAILGTSVTGWVVCLSGMDGDGGMGQTAFNIDFDVCCCRYRNNPANVLQKPDTKPYRRHPSRLCGSDDRNVDDERRYKGRHGRFRTVCETCAYVLEPLCRNSCGYAYNVRLAERICDRRNLAGAFRHRSDFV